jgi:hypothetical protein
VSGPLWDAEQRARIAERENAAREKCDPETRGRTHDLLQRVIIDALESGDYTVEDVQRNTQTAIERYEQFVAGEEDGE